MGDMADYILEQDFWAAEDFDGLEQEDENYTKTCRYCGMTGLVWLEKGGKFMLASDYGKTIHRCKVNTGAFR